MESSEMRAQFELRCPHADLSAVCTPLTSSCFESVRTVLAM